jgi:hypothetical protein
LYAYYVHADWSQDFEMADSYVGEKKVRNREREVLQAVFFSSGIPTKMLCVFFDTPVRATCPVDFGLLDLVTLHNICLGVQK